MMAAMEGSTSGRSADAECASWVRAMMAVVEPDRSLGLTSSTKVG